MCNHSVKAGEMTDDPAGVVLGETMCLPARSPALRDEGKAEPLKDGHQHPLALLNLTSVKSTVTHTISTKTAFQGVGSVLVGTVECNNEVNSRDSLHIVLATLRGRLPLPLEIRHSGVLRGSRQPGRHPSLKDYINVTFLPLLLLVTTLVMTTSKNPLKIRTNLFRIAWF